MKKRNWSKLCSVALSVALTVTMLPEMTPMPVAAAEDDSDYVATPEVDRVITTGTMDERTWKIDWSDEFNGEELDSSKWSYMIGTGAEYSGDGWGNNELEYYTKGENAEVADGVLTITAKKLADSEKGNYAGKSYTSTRLWTMDDSANPGGSKITKYAKKYGRIEARVKITSDATDGNSTGLWPAFWMMPSEDVYGTWAASGEIDIMEIRGRLPREVDGTIHYGSMWPNNKSNGGSYNAANTLTTYDESFTTAEYHTYAIEWLPGEIRWYMDDQLFYKTSNWYSTTANNATDFTYPAPFNQNFYLLLNLAVGGNYDGGALSNSWNNAWMDVDYVRVYDLIDPSTGEIADYSLMEDQAVKPVDKADDHLVSGVINETNYIASDLSGIRATTSYPSETDNIWYLSTMLGGTATTSMNGDALKVDVTAPGSQNYSVQLIHNVPLTKGYRYVLTFDAKADVTKTISAKYGNIAGYPAYSDSYEVALTADWKNYTYTFDMTNKTDATGRLEFNLGLSTGASYFKNFSVLCTGLTPTLGEDDPKAPLANGNHVYNGTFDQGSGGYYFWHAAADTSISVDKSMYELSVVGTSNHSHVYQKGMNLLGGDSYQLSLDAKAITPGDITVKLVSNDGGTVYGEKTISIGSSYLSEPYSFDFTMEAGITDTAGRLEIKTGINTVWIDNVRLIRTSNNNVDWSKVDFWPLYNSDFYNGADGWNIWSEKAGYQTHSVTNGILNVHSTVGAGADFWCVGVESSSMNFIGGIPYKITVHLNGSKDKTIKLKTPDGVEKDYQFASGDNVVSIEFKPAKDLTGKFAMFFGIGEGTYDFTIDRIDVEVDSSKIAIPSGHAKPAGVTSAGNVKEGMPIVINYSDEAWASKLTKVYVNGTEVSPDAITVNHNNTLTIASTVMPVAGNYSIKFDAEGYAQTKAITQTILEVSGNLMTNGSFDTDLNGWETYFSDWNVVNGTAKVEEGKAVINVVSTEGNNWDCQLKQVGIDVEAGAYYLLQFDASSSINRPIQLEFGNLGVASQTIVNLTSTTDTYYIVLRDVPTTDAASVLFMTGNVNGCLENFPAVGAHDIFLDNVKLYASSKEQVDALENPTLSITDYVVLGNDIVFHYTENSIWENNGITVSHMGTDITLAVAIDKTANTITIDKSVVTTPGNFEVVIKADGFKPITTTVKVLVARGENLFTGDWISWLENEEQGTLTCNEDELIVDFVSTFTSPWNGPEFWSMQARKAGIPVFAGKEYKFTFDAELIYDDPAVMENRGLVIEMGSQPDQKVVDIKPGKDHYEIIVSSGTRADYYILFLAGGNAFDVKPHKLVLTNIKFAEAVEEPEVPVAVTGVILDQHTLTMAVSGAAITLQAEVVPATATNKKVIWSSSDETVATVDQGTVVAVASGSALITVITEEGGYQDSCLVTVTESNPPVEEPEDIKVTMITVNSSSEEMTLGSSLPMTATVLPINATDATVVWSVENGTGVGTISLDGIVTAQAIGTITVKAIAKDGSGVFGTKTISIIHTPDNNNPTPTPTPTPIPVPTTTPSGNNPPQPTSDQNKEKEPVKIVVKPENLTAVEGNLVIPLSDVDLRSVLSSKDVTAITVEITLPQLPLDSSGKAPNITLDGKVLSAIKASGKDLTLSIKNSEGKVIYDWIFEAEQLLSSQASLTDVNLGLERQAVKDHEGLQELNKKARLGNGAVFHFNQEGLLPSQAGVRIYVGDLVKTSGDTKIYLYRYNKDTNMLETLPYSSQYVVDSEGYISVDVIYGSDYVALLHSANKNIFHSLREQVSVAPTKNTLTLSSTKDRTTQINITLPSTLTIVEELKDPVAQSAIGGVTITYTSSDEAVAIVDENGKVTAVGKGTTVITTTVTLYSGKRKIVKTEITVE